MSIVRVRGLPFSANESDLYTFFEGWTVTECILARRGGRPSGEAFVTFRTSEDASAAREALNGKYLGSRYLEIFEAQEQDLNAAREGDAPMLGGAGAAQRSWVLRLRGLPFSASAEQVVEFFGPDHVILGGAQGVVLTRDQDGRPTGEAFVEVPSQAAQQAALTLHRARMGPRYIEIFVASKPDMQQAMQRNRQVARLGEAQSRRRAPLLPLPLPSAPGISPDGTTLKLRGLPYSAGVDDITEWLADFKLADDGVKLMTKADRAGERVNTGIAFVRFQDAQEAALAAAAQHRKMMGNRYIECIPYTAPQRGQVMMQRPPGGAMMGGPALYPAHIAMQLPPPLPYGMPVGRPQYAPRGGVQGQPYGRGRGLEGRGVPPRMPVLPGIPPLQVYQQQEFQQPGRPSPQPPQQQQQILAHQHQQYYMQQQLMAQQQQQQQMAMRGMRPEWGQGGAGVPMAVPPQALGGSRAGVQWYMPPPPGSDAGMSPGMPMMPGPAVPGNVYGGSYSPYPYSIPMAGYGPGVQSQPQQSSQEPSPPAALLSVGVGRGEAEADTQATAGALPASLSRQQSSAEQQAVVHSPTQQERSE